MNTIAAVKAHRRGHDTETVGLLERAEARFGVAPGPGGIRVRIMQLVTTIAHQDPTKRTLAAEIERLVAETFAE